MDQDKRRVGEIIRLLRKHYPQSRTALEFRNPFEIMVATILAAQCTDERVNKVTPEVFRRWPTAEALAGAQPLELERAIQSTGFFRAKTRSILECTRDIVHRHGGQVPSTLEELTRLRGVGRKTANVVLGNAFGVPGLVVDTHVGRLARRLGLTRNEDPVKVEFELMERIPREEWTLFSHLLIHHGRKVCPARRPHCSACALLDLCPRVGVSDSD